MVSVSVRETVSYGLIDGTTLTEVTGSPFDSYSKTANTSILSRVKLLVPVIPPTFYAAGVNYREHVTEMAHRRGVKPEFRRTPTSVTAPTTRWSRPTSRSSSPRTRPIRSSTRASWSR